MKNVSTQLIQNGIIVRENGIYYCPHSPGLGFTIVCKCISCKFKKNTSLLVTSTIMMSPVNYNYYYNDSSELYSSLRLSLLVWQCCLVSGCLCPLPWTEGMQLCMQVMIEEVFTQQRSVRFCMRLWGWLNASKSESIVLALNCSYLDLSSELLHVTAVSRIVLYTCTMGVLCKHLNDYDAHSNC